MIHPLRAAAAATLVSMLATSPALAQEKTQKPPLHGSHWMAITGKPLAATAGATHVRARRQRGRRRLRHARGDVDDVGRAVLGRRDAGAHLQPEDEEDHRDQRARRRADRRNRRVLSRPRDQVSAGGRAALRRHAGHARRAHHDAGGVRHALARRGARARDHARRRLRRSMPRPPIASRSKRRRSRNGRTRSE